MRNVKRTLTPEKAVEILEEYGTKMTIEEAEIALDFIYEFTELVIVEKCKTKPKLSSIMRRPLPKGSMPRS